MTIAQRLVGAPPTEEDVRSLCENSWLSDEIIEQAQIRRVDDATARELLGRNGRSGAYQGLAFPYFLPGQDHVREYRVRRDQPDIESKDGKLKERGKYLSPPGRGNQLYFVPGTPPEALSDTDLPVTLAEGEKKTLALHRLATWGDPTKPRWLAVGLSGVWNWRGTTGKTTGSDGGRRDVKGVIGDFDRITWDDRLAYICFDSDVHTNPSVQAARRQLLAELRSRGARCRLVTLPNREGAKVSVDDLLASDGPDAVLALFDEATETGDPDLTRQPYTDAGNAERLVLMHGQDIRYCTELKGWLIWDGRRWTRDTTGQVQRFAIYTMRAMYRQAAGITDGGQRERAERHARKSEQSRTVRDMLALAQCQPGITVSVLEFDRQAYLLNCLNGTLELKTGTLRPHRRSDLLMKLCPHRYKPEADCPRYLRSLHRAMGDREGASAGAAEAAHVRVEFLQKAVGMSLTADVGEKAVFCLFGDTDAGKTTFLNAIRHVLGDDYAGQVLIESLMANARQSDNNSKADLVDLLGKRFVTTSEAEAFQRLAEGRLKYLTQGAYSRIKAARKYENPIEFPATHKLWLDANERPQIRSADDSVWKRLRPIPFDYPLQKDEIDKELPQRLQTEAEGILAWAMQGCLRCLEEGLGEIPDVQEARHDWRTECDPLSDFIGDECELTLEEPKAFAWKSDVRSRYECWCARNGDKPLGGRVFAERLRALGCNEGKRYDDGTQRRTWEGVRLK